MTSIPMPLLCQYSAINIFILVFLVFYQNVGLWLDICNIHSHYRRNHLTYLREYLHFYNHLRFYLPWPRYLFFALFLDVALYFVCCPRPCAVFFGFDSILFPVFHVIAIILSCEYVWWSCCYRCATRYSISHSTTSFAIDLDSRTATCNCSGVRWTWNAWF